MRKETHMIVYSGHCQAKLAGSQGDGQGLGGSGVFNSDVIVRVNGLRWSRWIVMVKINSETGTKPKYLVLAVTGSPLKTEGC